MLRELTISELESFPALEWSDIAARVTPARRSSLEKILETQNGADLSLEESYALANSEGDDLLGLLVAANLLRAELAGNIVTYVVNRNINFTNICFVGCKFCAFSRGPRESDAYFHSLRTWRGRRWKPGNSAPPKSAFRAACPAIFPSSTIATFSAPSSGPFRACISTPFRRWKLSTASNSPAWGCATIFPCCATTGWALCPAPPPKSSTTRFATSSRPTSFPPRSGSRSSAPLTNAAFAPRRRSCMDTPKLRRTGFARCDFCAKFSPRPEASPNLSRSASSIRTRCSSTKAWREQAQRWPSILKFTRWRACCSPVPSTTFRFRG